MTCEELRNTGEQDTLPDSIPGSTSLSTYLPLKIPVQTICRSLRVLQSGPRCVTRSRRINVIQTVE